MKSPKAGQSKAAVAQREALFVEAYLRNKENGRVAAMEVGIPEASARVTACRWLKRPSVQKLLEQRREGLRSKFALSTDRTMLELARVSYFNPKALFKADGTPKAIHELDDDTAAALAAIETETGENGTLTRWRPFDKVAALEKVVKILRLYEEQPQTPEAPAIADTGETARRLAFLFARGAAANKTEPAPKPRKRLTVAV